VIYLQLPPPKYSPTFEPNFGYEHPCKEFSSEATSLDLSLSTLGMVTTRATKGG